MKKIPSSVEAVEDSIKKAAGKGNPFKEYTEAQKNLTAATVQGIKVTNQMLATQGSLKTQLKSLEGAYKTLTAQKAEFEAAGKANELKARLAEIKARIAAINSELKEAPKATDAMKSGIDKVGSALKTAFTITGVLFLIDKLFEVGKAIIGITSESDRFQSQFTRIFEGNGEAAKGYLAILQNTADTTNYTFDELAKNVASLASRGIIPTKEALLGLGDVANFINKDFSQLNEAILDANNSERWKELGFTVKTEGDKMTLSYGSFSKTVDNSVKGAYEAIQAFSQLKKVQGATEEAGLRLDGKVSSLTDSVARFFRTIGQGNDGALKDFINFLIKLVGVGTDVYKILEPSLQSAARAILSVGSALFDVIGSFGNFQTETAKTATVAQKLGYIISQNIVNPIAQVTLMVAEVVEGFNLLFLASQNLAARLSGNTGLAASATAGMATATLRIKEIRAELAKVRAESEKDLTAYVRQDELRKRREDRRARLATDAATNFKPTDTGTPAASASAAEKKAIQKALQDEQKLLLKSKEEYEKELAKLEEQFGKDRLESLKKDSVGYIEAQKDIDLKELENKKQQLIKLGQLASSGQTRRNAKTGELEVVPNLNYQLPLKAAKEFEDARAKIIYDAQQKTVAQKIRDELDILNLDIDSDKKQLAEFDRKWELQLMSEEKNSDKYLALIKKRDRDRVALETDINLKNIEANRVVFEATIGQREQGKGETAAEFAKRNALDRNANDRYFNENSIFELEKKNDPSKAPEIARLRATGKAIEEERKKIEAQPKYGSILDVLGIANGLDQTDTDQLIAASNQIISVIQSVAAAQVQASEERIAAIQAEIDAKQQQVDEEAARAKEGYANNLDLRKQELEDLKAQKAAEEEEKRKALRIQQEIDALTIISTNAVTVANLIAAAAAEFKKNAPIPFLGIALSLAAIATIYGTISSLSAKAKAITKLREGTDRFGIQDSGFVNGRSHEQGGHRIEGTNIEVEGGEFVGSRKSTAKFGSVYEALNNENPVQAAALLWHQLPMPNVRILEGYKPKGDHDAEIRRALDEQNELLREQNEYLKAAHEKPTETPLGDGRVKITKGSNSVIKKY